MKINTTKIQACRRCDIRAKCKHVVLGEGSNKAGIMIVSEYPNRQDDMQDEVLTGRIGAFMDMILRTCNLSRQDVYITNAVKCSTAPKQPAEEYITNCKAWLWHEIQQVKPTVIITMGNLPTRLLLKADPKKLKMGEFVNRPLKVPYLNATVIACYHPSYYLRRPRDEIRQVFIDVINSAKELVS